MDSPQIHEAEPEEQHEGGQDEPAVDELDTNTGTEMGKRWQQLHSNPTSCRCFTLKQMLITGCVGLKCELQ